MKIQIALAAMAAITLTGSAYAHDQSAAHSDTFGTVTDSKTEDGRPVGPGSHIMLRAPIASADGIEVIISDVIIPPNASVPLHYHPGEEFLYVIEGSAIHVESGKDDQILKVGDAYVIPPEAVHAPRGGPEGARAIVFRVHKDGNPERILVNE